jgi:Domain of unknown function (DUF4129)
VSRRRLAAGAAALAGLFPAPVAAAPPAPPVAVEYLRDVDGAVAALRASPPDADRARDAVAAAERLQPRTPAVPLDPVAADLSRRPPDVGDAVVRLEAIAGVLVLPPGARPGDDAAARQRLDEVYRRPAFAHLDESPRPSLLAALVDALGRLLGGLGGALGPSGSVLAGGAVVGLALLLTARLVRGASARRRRTLPEEEIAPGADAEQEWSAALGAAAAGDHREAVRHAFRSALLAVAQRGRLAVQASWTTRELLARAAGDADLLAALAPAAAAFDRAWYSGAAVSEADWEVARDRCAAVRRLAGGARVAG